MGIGWRQEDTMEVIPKSQRKAVVEELHGGKMSGHLGFKRTFARVRSFYFWSGVRADVRSCIRECGRCAKRKSPLKKNNTPSTEKRRLPNGKGGIGHNWSIARNRRR